MSEIDTAQKAWREWTANPFDWDKNYPPNWQDAQQETEETAHNYINALEAENRALRAFCYECKHLDGWAWCREMSLDEQREHDKRGERDHCHFTPSRWQRREP